jgi:hypothetical protein
MRPKGMNSMTINRLLVHIVNQAMEEILPIKALLIIKEYYLSFDK